MDFFGAALGISICLTTFNWQHLELDHAFYLNNKLFNKNKTQLKLIIIKVIGCTLLSICVLLNVLQVLPDFKNLTSVKHNTNCIEKSK